MKESTLASKILILILCLGVLAYLAVYLFIGFNNELITTTAYTYEVDLGTEASALIVRQETVLNQSGSYVDKVLSEGEKTSRGEAVALIYSDPSALNTRQQIRALTAEIQQLKYALSTGTQAVDTARLDEMVIDSIVSLRALTAGGDLTALDESALNLRTMVFRREFSYGDTEAAAELAATIREKESQLSTLTGSLHQVSQTVYAPTAGVFSGSVDGYETLITPADLAGLTPEQLDSLISLRPSPSLSAGKVITDSTWYLAALFEGENSYGLKEGRRYTVSFSHDYYGDVEMKLERLVPDGQRTLVIFSCRTHLKDTTLLRVQTVDIVTSRLEGIRIPRKALRVETDPETGHNRYGVYTVVGSQAEWQEVNVIHTGDTYYLVRPVEEDSASRLRAGDLVILSTAGIFDGKVVR